MNQGRPTSRWLFTAHDPVNEISDAEVRLGEAQGDAARRTAALMHLDDPAGKEEFLPKVLEDLKHAE